MYLAVRSAIELFINQLNTNQEITITDFKVKRYFMSIKSLQLSFKCNKTKKLGRIYILNMGKQILVKNIIEKLAELKKKTDKLKLKLKKLDFKKVKN